MSDIHFWINLFYISTRRTQAWLIWMSVFMALYTKGWRRWRCVAEIQIFLSVDSEWYFLILSRVFRWYVVLLGTWWTSIPSSPLAPCWCHITPAQPPPFPDITKINKQLQGTLRSEVTFLHQGRSAQRVSDVMFLNQGPSVDCVRSAIDMIFELPLIPLFTLPEERRKRPIPVSSMCTWELFVCLFIFDSLSYPCFLSDLGQEERSQGQSECPQCESELPGSWGSARDGCTLYTVYLGYIWVCSAHHSKMKGLNKKHF